MMGFRYASFCRLTGFLIRGLSICFLVAWLGNCQSTANTSSDAYKPAPVYTLGPGDKVRVTVYQHEKLSGVFEVDSSGRVSLPLVRGIQAAGLTVVGLEEAIITRLKKESFGNTKVSVDLAKLRPVCILGEVNKPGCFDYIYGMRVAAAVAMAGGYTYRAKKYDLEVMRGNGARIITDHDALVYPGDVIEVDERYF
jgi:polysaccharide export outer membrane protein